MGALLRILLVLPGFTLALAHALSGQSSLENLFQEAQAASARGEYTVSESLYREIIRRDPQRGSAFNNLGIVLISEKKLRDAVEVLQQALKVNPNSSGTYVLLGMAYYELFDSQRAISAFQSALYQNPKDTNALFYLGKAQMQARDYQQAAEIFAKLRKLEPEDRDILYDSSIAYMKLMLDAVNQLTEVAPNSHQLFLFQAQDAEARGDQEAAIGYYKEAIRAKPETVGVHFGLGVVYVKSGKYDEAAHEFLNELQLNPNDSLALWRLGELELRTDPAKAKGHLEYAVSLNTNLPQAALAYGRALLMTGDSQDAISQFRRVVQLAPEEDSVHYLLAVAYRTLGKPQEVKEEIARFEALAKIKSDGRMQLAREIVERGLKTQDPPPDIEPGFSSVRNTEHP